MGSGRGLVRLAAEAGPALGMGHLARSSALARALRLRGYETETLGIGLERPVAIDEITWEPSRLPSSRGEEILLVCDGYGLPALLTGYDGAVASLHERWEASAPERVGWLEIGGRPAPTALVDLRYSCLRSPFWALPDHEFREQVSSMLITTGGSDAAARVDGPAAELAAAIPDAEIVAIKGPFSSASAVPGVLMLDSPPDLAGPMLEADLIVTAAGQTMLEAMACGAPTVAIALAADQGPQAAIAADASAVVLADLADLVGAARRLAADPVRRRSIATAARSAVDGLGAHRVARGIFSPLDGPVDGFPGVGGIDLAPAGLEDSEFLLALRNDPAVRAASRSTDPVTEDEHRAWFERSLQSPDRHLFVVEEQGRRLGQLRLDLDPDGCELSISLDAAARGSGIGGLAIRSGSLFAFTELDRRSVHAWVAGDNAASARAFERSGFRPREGAGGDGFIRLDCDPASMAWD